MTAAIITVVSVVMLAVICVLLVGLHRQNERMARLLREDERRID